MTLPLGEHHTDGNSDTKSKKSDRHKQTILVIIGVIGVGLTYLLYRRNAANSASTNAYTTAPGNAAGVAAGNNGSGGQTDYSGLLNNIGSQLGQLSASVSALQDAQTKTQQQTASNTSSETSLAKLVANMENTLSKQHASIASNVSQPKKANIAPSSAHSTQQHYYTVQQGDNLSEIAGKYHETWQQLYSANKGVVGSNPNLIYAGQRLSVP